MVGKNWVLKNYGDQDEIDNLSTALSIEKSIANILVQRGIKTYESAKQFFRPSLSDLHDPFLMKDMEKAVNRIEKAIKTKEKVLIYGDYDVDGTTSVALVFSFLKKYIKDIDYYVPDRYAEGYGVSYQGIDFAHLNRFSLIIALDCGIKSVEKVRYAQERNIDFIICDHHTSGLIIPEAVAVLDPKRNDCPYPYKELSGCGVGFKMIQAYALKNNIPNEEIMSLLDLVCVSIASDIVPVTGENRVLTHYGLKQLNENPRTGLRAIINTAKLDGQEINIDDIVFKIGPRINAAGRIESGKHSVDLLISENEELAYNMSDQINNYNNTRRTIDGSITQEALSLISENEKLINKKTTVLFDPGWHKGVIGIVASRLTESYYRPTVVLTESNGVITGSARSVVGFDLYNAIEACSHLLENFGGHMYAAGLTMKKENLKAFQDKFEEVVTEIIEPEQLIPQIEIDTVISLSDITQKFYRIIKQFQPFGPGNMAPVFLTESVVDNGTGKPVGNSGDHLKLNLIQEEDPYTIFPAIAFGLAGHYPKISKGYGFDICYSIDENHFRGNTTLQLKIKDIKTD